MLRLIERGIFLAATMGLAACGGPPEFSQPLDASFKAPEVHQRLAGTWVWAGADGKENDAYVLHMRVDENDGLFGTALFSTVKGDKFMPLWWRSRAFAAQIDGNLYVDFQREKGVGDDYTASGLEPGHMIAKIRFEGDNLLYVRLLNREFEREAETGWLNVRKVKGHNLAGEVPYYHLTTQTGDLERLLRDADALRLFGDEGRFQRVPAAPKTPKSPDSGN